jgi:pyrimidine operon attenuation protein/uracil phosphoribosyltransferase
MRNQYDEEDVGKFIDHLVCGISSEFPPGAPLNVVGIRTRGETLAGRIASLLQQRHYGALGRGVLDITLYRDDLSEIGPRPMVRPTRIDIDLDARPLLLVDDVLFTGRSVRAALDALSDFGRPGVIRLAVLVDRGGRELPIQPDYVGLKLSDVPRTHHVQVRLRETDGVDEIEVGPGK